MHLLRLWEKCWWIFRIILIGIHLSRKFLAILEKNSKFMSIFSFPMTKHKIILIRLFLKIIQISLDGLELFAAVAFFGASIISCTNKFNKTNVNLLMEKSLEVVLVHYLIVWWKQKLWRDLKWWMKNWKKCVNKNKKVIELNDFWRLH